MSAQLTLNFSGTPAPVKGYYLKNAWKETANAIGWLYRDTGLSWSGPGASGDGTDRVAGKSFLLPAPASGNTWTMTVDLDPAVVSSWINTPGSNQGILLTNEESGGKIARVLSSTNAAVEKRPKLTIQYTTGVPPVVSLLSPLSGAALEGPVILRASASDNDGNVSQVEFLLDGTPLTPALANSPYDLPVDTRTWANGPHTVAVQATDNVGLKTVTAAIPISVANVVPVSSTFFAPPVTAGAVTVTLHPVANVTAGTQELVTFGVPFSRGSLPVSALNTLRVLKNGLEIPAYVATAAVWRHTSNAAIDGKSVRVARIQIKNTFATATGAENLTVSWGGPARTLSVSIYQDPKTAWHTVTSGTFVAADSIKEPDVFVTLPPQHMAEMGFSPLRLSPFDPGVSVARNDPATVDNKTDWPGFTQFQTAEKNFFYSIINEDDPRVTSANKNPYKTGYEPWLYDRSTAMFNLYFQSGWLKPLREAVRSSQFYAKKLYPSGTSPARAIGLLTLKVPNPLTWAGGNGAMYSYNECLAYTMWMTGDDTLLDDIDNVVSAHEMNSAPTRWSPTGASWTERQAGYRLLANVIGYEVTGNPTYRNNLLSQATDLIWHQNGAGGILPTSRVDGGLYHYGSQHGDGAATSLIASSWMSVLISEAMTRAYAVTEDPQIADFVRRLGRFMKAASRSDANHQYLDVYSGALLYPDYLTRLNGTAEVRDGSDAEHAMDVSTGTAWAYFFSKMLGVADPTLKTTTEALNKTYSHGLDYWTRPLGPASGLTAYRNAPWRKYGWQYTPALSFTWLMQ